MIKRIISFTCLVFIFSVATSQVKVVNPRTDMKLLHDFESRKLGLFLHLLPVFTPETGDAWAIGRGVSKKKADSIIMAYDPKNFNAKAIVDFAKKAGVKYIVIVARHHSGFCLWDSKYTDFDLHKPKFQRDLLKELEEECHKNGLLYGIYYSIGDTHYTGWDMIPAAGQEMPPPQKGEKNFKQFVHNQVKELITRYDPDILWFDGYWLGKYWTPQDGKDLYNTIKATKNSILSTRLSVTKDSTGRETFFPDGSQGDFFSWEASGRNVLPDFPWEGCTSISYPVYGFDPNAHMYSKEKLISLFDETLCANGNFLLNIGPKRDGSLPKIQTDRFLQMSDWIQQNKEAVYNTTGGPFKPGDWGGSTYKDKNIYLHLRAHWNTISIDQLDGYRVLSAKELSTGKELPLVETQHGYIINVSDLKNDDNISVIQLQLDKTFKFNHWLNAYSQLSL